METMRRDGEREGNAVPERVNRSTQQRTKEEPTAAHEHYGQLRHHRKSAFPQSLRTDARHRTADADAGSSSSGSGTHERRGRPLAAAAAGARERRPAKVAGRGTLAAPPAAHTRHDVGRGHTCRGWPSAAACMSVELFSSHVRCGRYIQHEGRDRIACC